MGYAKPWSSDTAAVDTTIYSDPIYVGPAKTFGAAISYTQPRVEAVASSLAVQDLTYTAVDAGVAGDSITIAYIDPPGNNVALSVAVTGTDIEVTLATNGSSVVTSTAAQVKAAIEADGDAAALVTVAVTGTASTVQAAAVATPLAGGADETNGSVDVKVYIQGSYEHIVPYTSTVPTTWVNLDSGTAVAGSAPGTGAVKIADLAAYWIRLAWVPAVGGSDRTTLTAEASFKGG